MLKVVCCYISVYLGESQIFCTFSLNTSVGLKVIMKLIAIFHLTLDQNDKGNNSFKFYFAFNFLILSNTERTNKAALDPLSCTSGVLADGYCHTI